jgi:hypothetical protein
MRDYDDKGRFFLHALLPSPVAFFAVGEGWGSELEKD